MSSQDSGVDWDAVGHVRGSRYRMAVVEALAERPQTPSEIANGDDMNTHHVSRALSQLGDEELVELLVDESVQKGRIYGLTDAGEAVVAHL